MVSRGLFYFVTAILFLAGILLIAYQRITFSVPFVPNLASGKGWLALAAVFMGRKKLGKISVFTIIFCVIEYAAVLIQNYIITILLSFVTCMFVYFVTLLITKDDAMNEILNMIKNKLVRIQSRGCK